MKTKLVLFLSLVGIILSAAACSAAAGQTPGGTEPPGEKKVTVTAVEVSYDELTSSQHISRQIEITYPGTLQVTLYSNPTTGYSWSEDAEIADSKVMQQESHEYTPLPSNGNMVGTGGKEVWIFKTLTQGKTELSMEYSQPWSGGEKKTWTFELIVTVK